MVAQAVPSALVDSGSIGMRENTNRIVAKLREHESELKAAGVEHLFLHGSYARGTAVRVDLSPAKGLKEPVAAKASCEAVLAF